jgi:hypothetical protein
MARGICFVPMPPALGSQGEKQIPHPKSGFGMTKLAAVRCEGVCRKLNTPTFGHTPTFANTPAFTPTFVIPKRGFMARGICFACATGNAKPGRSGFLTQKAGPE